MLVLDSSLDETSGPQGQWFTQALDTCPQMLISFSSSFTILPTPVPRDEKKFGGGHSSRNPEQMLAEMLEARQQNTARPISLSSPDTYTITNAMSTAALLILF